MQVRVVIGRWLRFLPLMKVNRDKPGRCFELNFYVENVSINLSALCIHCVQNSVTEEASIHLHDRGASGPEAEVPVPNLDLSPIFPTSGHQRRRETFNHSERHGIAFPFPDNAERIHHRQTPLWRARFKIGRKFRFNWAMSFRT
jgi:hypothetical protein